MARTVFDTCPECGWAGFVYDTDNDGNLTVRCECLRCVEMWHHNQALQNLATQAQELNMGYGHIDQDTDYCVTI